jgi:hypothetical protein
LVAQRPLPSMMMATWSTVLVSRWSLAAKIQIP